LFAVRVLKKQEKNMKKLVGLLLVASLGGLAAVGITKLFEKDHTSEFQALQMARYAGLKEQSLSMGQDFTSVSEVVTPTVVHVLTTLDVAHNQSPSQGFDPFDFFRDHGFSMPDPGPQIGSGSGVIISADGYIITNNHVINGANKIEVVLNDKRKYLADLVGTDPNTDIALLKVEEKNLPFALFGNSDEVKIGQWVLAVGNPFNLTSTVTAGIVSAKGRNLNLIRDPQNPESRYAIESFIQTDAAVNPGNSGGALVSTDGRLIGINTAIASQTGSFAGYSFAVPSNIAKKVINDIMKYGAVQRGYLGVEIRDVNAELADEKGLKEVKGVYVNGVSPKGAADEAGVKEGDVILKIGEVAVNSASELQEQVSGRNPGDRVALTLRREGKERIIEVILRNREGKTRITSETKVDHTSALGAEFESLGREERLSRKLSNGVKVKSISGKSVLRKAGVPEGYILTHIDKKSVYTISDVKKLLDGKKGGVLLEGLNPDGSKGVYGIALEQ
jgi:serine protease Do